MYQTLDGYIVNKDIDGYYKYVLSFDNKNNIIFSTVSAKDFESRGKWEKENMSDVCTIEKAYEIIKSSDFNRQNANIRELGTITNAALKSIGKNKIPVVLVQFADLKFSISSNTDSIVSFYNKYCNGTNDGKNYTGAGSAGAIKDYFIAQSDSLFMPEFDIIGPITLDSSYVHYGKDLGYRTDVNINDFWEESMLKAIDLVNDWNLYDNDKNGSVDIVLFYYAGEGQNGSSDSNTIWPKDWISGGIVGNMKLGSYVCANELFKGEIDGIGLSCHELSHALGLPDFYDIYYNAFGMDYWDIMDYGDNTLRGYAPIGYNAYERDFMGWRKLVELTEKGDYSAVALTSGGVGYKIVNDANPNEYYILENRQAEGFDKYIINTGMLIIHVDYDKNYWSSNRINNDPSHERFTIIPADGERLKSKSATSTTEYKNNLLGDVWPGPTGNTELTDYSTPAARVFTGGYMSKPIRNIRLNNGVIHFSFMRDELTAPTAYAATNVTDNSFTASWSKVNDAEHYILTLEKAASGNGNISLTNLLTEDFYNCTSANIAINSPDKYFSKTGWKAANIFTNVGTLRIGTSTGVGTLTTPTINKKGLINISYKVRLHDAKDTGVVLTLSTTDGETIDTVEPTDTWSERSVTFTANEQLNIIFSTEESSGRKRVVVDDIKISLQRDEIIQPLETIETTETSHTFSGLESNTLYRYSVSAVDASGNETESSDVIYVSLGEVTTVETPALHSSIVEIYTLNGVKIYSGASSAIPNIKQGVYIYKEHTGVRKVYIK
jgi:M6 family metalloprotease-like protein